MKKPTLTLQFWSEGIRIKQPDDYIDVVSFALKKPDESCELKANYPDTTATYSHIWHLDVPKTKWWQKFLLFFVPMRVWETEECVICDKILFCFYL